ncbi:TPA: hypothetical protein RQO57_004494 [Aeromonas dhakensis]|uniref:hypothetical protein n=1 Tax=Aeromonas dhakensis TaxID=196024 RepID=UPI00288DBA18|nr:hypothetical protein [Aeromonas dhakensis]
MNKITQFTQIQERHGPLLAFRRETFSRDISTAEAAQLLLQSAHDLKLTDRQALYGNTLNSWMTGGKAPSWAIQAAIHWLERNGWYPGVARNQGNLDHAKSDSSDFAWWAYSKIKLHGTLANAKANIPNEWPADIRENAEAWLAMSWQVEEEKRTKRAEERHD